MQGTFMQKIAAVALLSALVVGGATLAQADEKTPQKVIDLAQSMLVKMGMDPIIVQAIKAENAKGKTLDQIKALDTQWQATAGVVDYMQALMASVCGQHLQKIQQSAPYYAEIFAMDNQGANVCMTDKTSDYWQGDEAKFIESYKGGAGAVHIGGVKFDDSTQTYLVQVSVPVKDGGQVVGAMTIGIDVEKIVH